MEILYNPYILLLIAFLLVFLEFFLPGGIFGLFGAIFIVLSFISFFLEGHSPWISLLYFVAVITALIFLIKFILQAIRSTGKENTIFLSRNQEGYFASSYDKSLIGKTGIALTPLKPSGKILIEGKEVQAINEMGYLHQGEKVIVIGGQGAHVIVRLYGN